MQGVVIADGFVTLNRVPNMALACKMHGGQYYVNDVITGDLGHPTLAYQPRRMQVILVPSKAETPFIEVRHVAHPWPVIITSRRLEGRGFSLAQYLHQMEDEVVFAERAAGTRDANQHTKGYRTTWASLYSIVHQDGKNNNHFESAIPMRDGAMRKRLLTIISAHKQMAVPVKQLNSLAEKLAFLEHLEKIFSDEYEFYACVRTYIIDQVGYRLFIETCELDKFTMPLRIRNRAAFAKELNKMTSPTHWIERTDFVDQKIGHALKQCFRLHNFN